MGLIKDFIPTTVQRGVKLTIVRLQIIAGRHGQVPIFRRALYCTSFWPILSFDSSISVNQNRKNFEKCHFSERRYFIFDELGIFFNGMKRNLGRCC